MPNATLENLVDEQLADHRGMNLFSHDSRKNFRFSERIGEAMEDFVEMSDRDATLLIDQTVNKTIAEFCRVNQYFSVDWKTRRNLTATYTILLQEIRKEFRNGNAESDVVIEDIERRHFVRLRQVLRQW